MDFSVSGELEDIFIACTSKQELGQSYIKRKAFGLLNILFNTEKHFWSKLPIHRCGKAGMIAGIFWEFWWMASPRAQVKESGPPSQEHPVDVVRG